MQFSYVSEYNTDETKYTGPYAIVNWNGEKLDDKMNGFGKILFANSNTYEGYVKDDKLHGHGILIDNVNCTIYDGDFVEDKREGFGKFTYNGGSYEGFYLKNKKHGTGIEKIGESILKGTFVDGNCIHGTLTYENGNVYIGEFNNELDRHGKGKYLDSEEGNILDGIWENDVFLRKETKDGSQKPSEKDNFIT